MIRFTNIIGHRFTWSHEHQGACTLNNTLLDLNLIEISVYTVTLCILHILHCLLLFNCSNPPLMMHVSNRWLLHVLNFIDIVNNVYLFNLLPLVFFDLTHHSRCSIFIILFILFFIIILVYRTWVILKNLWIITIQIELHCICKLFVAIRVSICTSHWKWQCGFDWVCRGLFGTATATDEVLNNFIGFACGTSTSLSTLERKQICLAWGL